MVLQLYVVLLVFALAIFDFDKLVDLTGVQSVEFDKANIELFGE